MQLCVFCVCVKEFARKARDKDRTPRKKRNTKVAEIKGKLNGRGDGLDNETRVRMSG